jgi:hypothetical protein
MYNNEPRGHVTYRVDKVDSDQVTVIVSPDPPSLGRPYTGVFAKDGNWLRHPLINHDMLVEYTFSPAYPAYVAPLDTGKSWSMRVRATNPNFGRSNSVRVDGKVLGTERITTPAGAFDAIYAFSVGIPRQISTLCNRLLLAAYLSEVQTIDTAQVEATVDEITVELSGLVMLFARLS